MATEVENKTGIAGQVAQALEKLGVPAETPALALGGKWVVGSGQPVSVSSPIDGSTLATISSAVPSDVDQAVERATVAFHQWKTVPAPIRGAVVREIGDSLREHKSDLAMLVTVECGKIYQEALGEVQEMIDICDFALGLSRQLYGLTIASERPLHRLTEQWHPLGPVGVISAFNFPVAVWAWNAMIALVCGDPVVWKPSEKTPLTAMACHAIALKAIQKQQAPEDLIQLVVGGQEIGQALAAHRGLPLISATGSIPMGKSVAQTVASRLGKSLARAWG